MQKPQAQNRMKVLRCFSCAPGFNLIEVVFAIALLGAVGAPILMLNYNVLVATDRSSELTERMIMLARVLHEQSLQPEQESEVKKDIKIDEPPATVVYERSAISPQSSLAAFKELQLVKASTTWTLKSGGSRTESVVSLAIRPIPPAEGKK